MSDSQKTISFTIPVVTPLLDAKQNLSLTWQRFFKCVSDYMKSGSIPQSTIVSDGEVALSYILNGAYCIVSTDLGEGKELSADTIVKLPFKSSLVFELYGITYYAGTEYVTIPAGTRAIMFNYVISN